MIQFVRLYVKKVKLEQRHINAKKMYNVRLDCMYLKILSKLR